MTHTPEQASSTESTIDTQKAHQRKKTIRTTVLLLLFFIVLGLVSSGIYRITDGNFDQQQLNKQLDAFFHIQ